MTPVLELENVAVALRGRPILRGVTLALAPGEIVALVGASGAGKTTLGRIAAGWLPPDRGAVRFLGRPLAGLNPRLQMVYQDPQRSLDPALPVAAIVTEGPELARTGAPSRPAAWRRGARRAWRESLATPWLALAGLSAELAPRLPAQLSGGQRQRVALARALAVNPAALVLDEPVSALDFPTGAQILATLRDLTARLGLASLLIAHHLPQAAAVADRIAVLDAGEIVELAPSARLLAAPQHPRTRALLAATFPWPPPTSAARA